MFKRPPDWAFYLLIVFLIYYNATRASDKMDAYSAPPDLGPLLPGETPRDPAVLIDMTEPVSGIGTAFAIDDDGRWITARHVVDGCKSIGIQIGARQGIVATAEVSNDTDIAILTTDWQRPPLAFDLDTQRRLGEMGYFYGFPQGRPGEAAGKLLGRHRLIVRGRYDTEEAVLAWSELGRTRGLRGSLGGMSGGPVMDKDGEVVGVVAAESPRRGRIYTVAPKSVKAVVTTPNRAGAQAINPEEYGLPGDLLRRQRRIAQVICIVG